MYPSNLIIHTTRSLDYEQSFFGEVRRVTLKKYEMYLLPFTSRVPRGCANIKGFSLFFVFRCFCFVLFVLLFVCFLGRGDALRSLPKRRDHL